MFPIQDNLCSMNQIEMTTGNTTCSLILDPKCLMLWKVNMGGLGVKRVS